MPAALIFQLPLPHRKLLPNERAHWSVKAAITKAARRVALVEARRVLADAGIPAPRWAKATWRAAFYLGPGNKRPDPDNSIAWLKAYLDGLGDGGVFANDRDIWPERPSFEKVEKMPRVEITISPEQ